MLGSEWLPHSRWIFLKWWPCESAGLSEGVWLCAGSSPQDQATFLKSNEYYFYQASDGQWLFLTALDMRILLAHYGAYGTLPGRLAAQVVNIDNITQTEVMRKKIKFLGHLPLTGACWLPACPLPGLSVCLMMSAALPEAHFIG